jgi:GH25 family lysozyme M1 (1,4-beta-N-acetylmuramidase)
MNKKIILSILGFYIALITNSQTILGIDISHHQGTINWTQVYNDGKVFAFVKATEGFTYDDPLFVSNMNNGNNAGVVMGAYHFARPDNNTAHDEATHFVNIAGSFIGQGFLPPVLDLENPNSNTDLTQLYTSAQLTNWVQTWMTEVENATGVRPIIYTNRSLAQYLQSSLNVYGMWIARPGTSPTSAPGNMGYWTTWKFKQYSWTGSVAGISGNVDLDSFNGSVTDFNTLIGTASVQNVIMNTLQIYPNPTTGIVYINNIDYISVDVFDTNGRLIFTQSIKNQQQIDLQNLEEGIYFIKVKDINGKLYVAKVIKE